jgi:hypothetical protein
VAAYVALGRKVRLQGAPRKGQEGTRKPLFHLEHEIPCGDLPRREWASLKRDKQREERSDVLDLENRRGLRTDAVAGGGVLDQVDAERRDDLL